MNTKRLIKSGMLAVLFLILAVSLAFAQAPLGTAFTYQGQLKSEGQPYTGTCDFQFGLYDVLTGGTPLGNLPLTGVPLTEGFFTVQLDFGAGAFMGEARWLDISVRCPAGTGDYTLLEPRQQLTAAPYALYATSAEAAETAIYAASADSVPWTGITSKPAGFADDIDNDTIYAAGSGLTLSGTSFAVNTAAIQARVSGVCGAGYAMKTINENGTVICEPVGSTVAWSLTGNAGTTPDTNYLGTSDNQAFEIKVNNQRVFRFEPNTTSPNLIGGYSGNAITPGVLGATISGGGISGYLNRVTDTYGSIGGGGDNQAGDADTDACNKPYATVAGGIQNAASGGYSAIGGGNNNTASGGNSAISGGYENAASGTASAIGGGYNNTASGYNSAIGGGIYNKASGDYSAIGGGFTNTASGGNSAIGAGNENAASGGYSAIGGGDTNTASGLISAIGGGFQNTASGYGSTIPGGYHNTASGSYSFAAGNYAHATTSGSFVWADAQDAAYNDHGVNTFNVRAQNGAFINAETNVNPGLFVYNNIEGTSAGQGTAILGRSNSNDGYGLAGWNYWAGVGVGAWSWSGDLIRAYGGEYPGGTLRFFVDQAGNVHYDGSMVPYVAIPSPRGGTPSYVSLYGIAAAEAWYEDLGSSSLVSGKAKVSIDPLFAQTVNLTEDYQVQVTATCNEPVLLYVSEKTTTYFTVQGVRLDGKPSNCAFDYRISAKAVGYETVRLEAVDIPEPVISEREE